MTTKTMKSRKTTKHEAIVNNAPRHFADADFPVGSVSHQGDVILVRLDKMPKGKARNNRQVAEGNTQGSRHILVGGEIFDCDTAAVAKLIKTVAKCDVDTKYIGPVFRGGELTHPEHGHQSFADEMIIAVVFQRNLDSEEREQKVLD